MFIQKGMVGMAKIISMAIQKGGCAKTTTSINLGSCLADKGNKVLLFKAYDIYTTSLLCLCYS